MDATLTPSPRAPSAPSRRPGAALAAAACLSLVGLPALTGLAGCPAPDDPSWLDAGVVLPPVDGGADVPLVPCTTDEDCGNVLRGPCQAAVCVGSPGACALVAAVDGVACTNGDACVLGETCAGGQCRGGAPKPPCSTVACGRDECGNACPSCAAGEVCSEGQCIAASCGPITYQGCCTPAGRVLWCDQGVVAEAACAPNPDASFAACGWVAAAGQYDCTEQAQPAPDPALPWACPNQDCGPDPCAGRACGFACGVACGACAAGQGCGPDGSCRPCSCAGRACGDDGCGGSCGDCAPGLACAGGQCQDLCGALTVAGCCDDATVRWCENGAVAERACGDLGCGWDATDAQYTCGPVTPDDPSGEHPRSCEAPPGPDAAPEPGPEAAPEPGPEPLAEPLPEPITEPAPDAGPGVDSDSGL